MKTHRRYWLWLALFSLCYLLLTWQFWHWLRAYTLEEIADTSAHQLNLYVQNLQGELEKYEFLPELFSSDARLVDSLKRPGDVQRMNALNRYLETVNRVIHASDTYLMDSEGLTIAASNWRSERPFVGRNFSYRPYFQQAMQGRLGRYFALGSTSFKRGYYFAYPVREGDNILGAVVIKVDLSAIEKHWRSRSGDVIVSDPDGIIFITTRPQWRYHSLKPLSPKVLKRIAASRRYGTNTIEPLGLELQGQTAQYAVWHLPATKRHRHYLVEAQTMPEAGWKVQILTPLERLQRQAFIVFLVAGIIYLALLLLALYLLQKIARKREKKEFERHAQEALLNANDRLEVRVRERTRDLSREIQERKRTEDALRQMQGELIHAAKLATLGQMSTSISHELNQPLAAIRSYADNARILLDHDRAVEARENLQQITGLTERMAQISSQLKLYARKTEGNNVDVALTEIIDAARHLLKPGLKSSGTTISLRMPDAGLRVMADPVQLEQVLVNIISNAVQAMNDAVKKEIVIKAQALDDRVQVSIRDFGAGIPPEHLQQVFEPFYTTRESGLGLGLSISQRIMESMGGSLSAANHPQGGAVFTLTLRSAE
jgi:two-component system C4-dicarboxylate transport sensor histidine kinase DctB